MIRRGVQAVLVVVLAASAWMIRPAEPAVSSDVGFEPERAAFVGCVGRSERSTDAILAVGSVVRGDLRFTRVPGNADATVTGSIDPSGGAVIDMTDVGAAGIVGVLTEMPSPDASAAVVMVGDGTASAAGCTSASTESVIAIGGSTMSGETLDLVMTNPYAIDAVVSVGSSSENGDDSASEIASILVPAGGTVVRQVSSLLPLRQSLSVRLEPQRGAVHAALLQTTSEDDAFVEAVPLAQDWWLPVLTVKDSSARLVVATDSPLPVNIQIDGYSAGDVTEAVFEGVVAPRSQLDIPLADLGGAPIGLRVSSDGLVAVGVVVDGASTRAVSPATTLSSEWILPGSGSFENSRAWVFNPGEVEAELVFQPLAEGQPARSSTVPPGAAVSVPMEAAGAGMLVRSSSEIAVMWSSRAGGFSLATGGPLAALGE